MSFVRIQAMAEKISGTEGQPRESAFDVINATEGALRIGVEPVGDAKAWVKIDPTQVELNLPARGQQKVKVSITPPAGSAGKKSSFSLRAYQIDNPGQTVVSVAVGFDVDPAKEIVTPPPPPGEKRKTPWGLIIGGAVGALVLIGGVIGIIIATRTAKVPDLVGKPLDEAVAMLTEGKLTPTVSEEISGSGDAGTVMRQEPAPGEPVPDDKVVKLVVEMVSVEVPRVVGLTVTAAGQRLGAVGLAVGTATAQLTGNSPGGTVTEQDPGEKTRAIPGTPINLTVEKELVSVPNLKGLNWNLASARAQESGLRIQARQQVNTGAVPGTVVVQEPDAAAKVDSGVTVAVDLEIAKVDVPSVINQSLQDATRNLGKASLVVAPVQPAYVLQPPFDTIAGQTPPPGSKVPPGTQVVLSVRTQQKIILQPWVPKPHLIVPNRTLIMKNPLGGTSLRVVPPEEP